MLICPLVLSAQKSTYSLKGKIGNIGAPAKVYLIKGPKQTVIASSGIQNGKFQFSGRLSDPEAVTLVLSYTGTGAYTGKGKQEFMDIYLEPGTISIASPDSLYHASIKGGNVNTANEKLKALLSGNNRETQAVMAAFRLLPEEKRRDENEKVRLVAALKQVRAKKSQLYIDFISSNPDSYVSLETLKFFGGPMPDHSKIAPLFNALSPGVRSTQSGKEYASRLEKIKSTEIGNMAPDFVQYDTSGKPVKLSDFKGRYVLVDFWASWCMPCRNENPNLVKAYGNYHHKGLEILGVSMDKEARRSDWLKAIQDDGLTWMNVADLKSNENQAATIYAIKAIPQNVLIDPSGKIIGRNLKGEALNNKLQEIFR